MLKILLKKQLTEIFRSCFYDAKKNRARGRIVTILSLLGFGLLLFVVLGGIFAALAYAMAQPLNMAGMSWLYFTLMGLIAVMLGSFGSIFSTYSVLYLARDNDQLLSLPIPVSTIMASRLLSVYLMGLLYSAIAFLPALIVYWLRVSADPGALLCGVVMLLLISLIVLIISCLLGWVVAKISVKTKRRSMMTVLISLLGVTVYYFGMSKLKPLLTDLIKNAASYGVSIRRSAYPLYLFGSAGTGDLGAMLIVAAAVSVLLGLTWRLLSHSFLSIATASAGAEGRKYREPTVKSASVHAALLRREFLRFTGSATYMLNCGMSTLVMPVLGIALLVKGDVLLNMAGNLPAEVFSVMPLLLLGVMCILISLNGTAAPSVSLEGKTIWLIQSLPVSAWQVLWAKAEMQMILGGVPALFCLICVAVACKLSMADTLLGLLMVGSFLLFSAMLALAAGVKYANLNWINESTPVKQGMSMFISLFGGIIYVVVLLAAILFLLPMVWTAGYMTYSLAFSLVTLVMAGLLYTWLRRRGCAIFEYMRGSV